MSRLPAGFLGILAFVAASVPCAAANHVLFNRLGPTQAALYVSNADGSGERILQRSGSLDYDPSWSPKGDWVVFTSERSGPAELFRIHPDGSGLEQLTRTPAYNDQAAFSPGEKRIVFVSSRAAGRANLWILDVATRKATRLTIGDGGDFRPSWSPDGKWIAFSSDRASNLPTAKGRWERLQLADLYVIHPDGSGLKRVSRHGGFCGSPKWTADSKSVVAYCMSAQDTYDFRLANRDGGDELLRFDIASGNSKPVAAGPGVKLMPTFLSSGEVGYLRSDKSAGGIFYGMGKIGPAGKDLRTPSWSPDGRRVVYSRFVTDIPVAPVKRWSRNPNYDLYSTQILPNYDLSGRRLAATKIIAPDTTSLYIVDQGKPPRAILTGHKFFLAPSWSPDGKRIAMGVGIFPGFSHPMGPVNGAAQVGIVNADGSGFHLVTSGANSNAFPSFSPDGKHIVYRTEGPDGQGLRIMNLTDRSVKVLTNAYDNFPIWSPRGDSIAFMRQIDGFFQILTIHPDGTALKQLTHVRGNEAHMAWSPDGDRLLFTDSRMGFKDEVLYENNPQPYGEICVMRDDGTDVEQLTDDQWEEGTPAWQPNAAVLSAKAAPAHNEIHVQTGK